VASALEVLGSSLNVAVSSSARRARPSAPLGSATASVTTGPTGPYARLGGRREPELGQQWCCHSRLSFCQRLPNVYGARQGRFRGSYTNSSARDVPVDFGDAQKNLFATSNLSRWREAGSGVPQDEGGGRR